MLSKESFGYVFIGKTKTPINQETSLASLMAIKSATMEKSSSLWHEKQVLCNLIAGPYVV